MCQAYEAEYNMISRAEDTATIAGFRAAMNGKTLLDNPFGQFEMYERKAWIHGWHCHNRVGTGGEPLLPWAIEKQFPLQARHTIAQQYRKDGKFRKKWLPLLNVYEPSLRDRVAEYNKAEAAKQAEADRPSRAIEFE